MLTLSLVLVRALQQADVARYGVAVADTSMDVLVGVFAGVAVAAFFGWRRSWGIENIFQRGVISALSAFGTLFVAFVLTWMVEGLLGFWGLVGLCVLLFAGGIASGMWACGSFGEAGRRKGEGAAPVPTSHG
ncbi:MAG TPA: hypothetical protein VI160_10790 [Gemmatimonadales bacterium]